jgi:hypothetical protein
MGGGSYSPGGYGSGALYSGGSSIEPGTASASYGDGMTYSDAQTQAADYDALQARLAQEAAAYEAQLAALPSSPANFSTSFQPAPVQNPVVSNNYAISLASPYSTGYVPY